MKHKNEVAYNPFRDVITPGEGERQDALYPYNNPKSMLEASVVHKGNIARMQKMLQKAQQGEKVHIVTLGGSITEGSGRSEGAYYGDVLYKWFKRRFNNENIVYTNIGRGTTTSLFGCARVERDIAPLEPDFIVVEYAVNDTILPQHIAKECFEALVRKLLSLPCAPCVFLLFTCLDSLASSQPLDVPIGLYYDLPMASLGDALKYHIQGKQNLPENYIKEYFIYDGVHPNTYGYSLLSDFIVFQLENAMGYPIIEKIPALPAEPLVSSRFMDACIQDSGQLKVVSNHRWEADDREVPYRQRGFSPKKVGDEICFSFSNCQFLSMVYRKSISPRAGIVQVQIDDNEPFTVDSYFHNGWGTYNDYMIILDTCEKKEHTVRITFTGEKSKQTLEKASCLQIKPEEVGSKFTLVEFLSA